MSHLRMIQRLVSVATTRPGLVAIATWPKFSLTSFEMVTSLWKQGIRPATVIDVGANEGQFAVAAAKAFQAPVYSFEPEPACAARLRQLVRRLSNVTVLETAVGDQEGLLTFYKNTDSRSASALPLGDRHKAMFPHAHEDGQVKVPVTTLDRAFESTDLRGPVLLKIDVQGYESAVLAGASRVLGQVKWVILETSFRPLYEGEQTFSDLWDVMSTAGFSFDRPVGFLIDEKTDEIVQMDALFTREN